MSEDQVNELKRQLADAKAKNKMLLQEITRLKNTQQKSINKKSDQSILSNVEDIEKSAKEFDDLVYCNAQLVLANEALADTIEQLKEELALARQNELSESPEYKTDKFIAKVQEQLINKKMECDKLNDEIKSLKELLAEQNEKLKKIRSASPGRNSPDRNRTKSLVNSLELDKESTDYLLGLPEAESTKEISKIIAKVIEKSKLQHETLNGILFELKRIMTDESRIPGARDQLFIDFVNQNIKIHGGGEQISLLSTTNLNNRSVALEKFVDKDDPLYQLFIAQFLFSIKQMKQNQKYKDELDNIQKSMSKHGLTDINEIDQLVASSFINADENDNLLEQNAKVTETNRMLSAENTSLAEHLAEISRDHSSLSIKLTEKDKQIESLKKMNSLLRQENEEKQNLITNLRSRTVSMLDYPIAVRHPESGSDSIVNELRMKVSKLQSKVRQLKRRQKNEISELTGLYESQRLSMSQTAESSLNQAAVDLDNLQKVNQKVNQELLKSKTEADELRREIENLKRGKSSLELQLSEAERKVAKAMQQSLEKDARIAKEIAERQREDKKRSQEREKTAVWPFLCAANMVALEYGISVDDINDFAKVMQLAKKDIGNLRYFQQNSVQYTK